MNSLYSLAGAEAHYNSQVDAFNQRIRELVQYARDDHIRYGKLPGLTTDNLLADGVHLNFDGYIKYAQCMRQELIQSCALAW